MKVRINIHAGLFLVALSCVFSVHAEEHSKVRSWQLAQLFDPGKAQVRAEKKGRVMIYSGLKDTEVQRAMDEQYDRIESMMFTSVVITNEQGEPQHDPVSGRIMVEDDGC